MKYGVCINLAEELEKKTLRSHLEAVRTAGFDYVEANLAALESLSDEALSEIRETLDRSGLPCPRANCFFPGTVRLTGPEASPEALLPYLNLILPRASRLGIEVIVLGSGGARRVPDGYDRQTAFQEFVSCARTAAEAADSFGIRIALEHLNPKETNLLTTVEETVRAMKLVDRPACGFLFDYYHADPVADDGEQTVLNQARLFHVHTALPGSRLFPFPEDQAAMEPFFRVLKKAGYDSTVSLEGNMRENVSYEENLAKSLQLLKNGFQA